MQKKFNSDVRRPGPVLRRLPAGKASRTSKETFMVKVLAVVAKIPKGKTLSYREVATQAGNPRAARAVGNCMKKNFDPKIPCHRVVRSDGTVGDYNRGGPEQKRKLLQAEGVL